LYRGENSMFGRKKKKIEVQVLKTTTLMKEDYEGFDDDEFFRW